MNSTAMRTGRLTDESLYLITQYGHPTLCRNPPREAGNLQRPPLLSASQPLLFPSQLIEAERPFLSALGSTYKFPLSPPLWCSSYLVLGSLLHC